MGAKTLWIGDVESWMDESYISSLFAGVSISHLSPFIYLPFLLGGLSPVSEINQRQAERYDLQLKI